MSGDAGDAVKGIYRAGIDVVGEGGGVESCGLDDARIPGIPSIPAMLHFRKGQAEAGGVFIGRGAGGRCIQRFNSSFFRQSQYK